jgi:hypothetical protein
MNSPAFSTKLRVMIVPSYCDSARIAGRFSSAGVLPLSEGLDDQSEGWEAQEEEIDASDVEPVAA